MANSIGIKISRPGVSVGTIPSLEDVDLHTSYPVLKLVVAEQGIENVEVTGIEGEAAGSITISHNLGYIPRVLVQASISGGFFHNDIDAYFKVPYELTSSGGMFGDAVGYELDSSQITINVSGYGWSEGAQFGYAIYMFYEER
jgi:hypothetical protein